MAENTDKESIQDPVNSEPESDQQETTLSNDEETIKTNQDKEIMEVHHHAHHEGAKNWKAYVWEFLMLFLAVFCGFLAEYKLEHVIEHQREEVYISSMIADVQKDLVNIKNAIAENNTRIVHLDSLADYCLNFTDSRTKGIDLYKHFIYGLYHPDFVTLTERTISQLKNAGGMRLIRNKLSADSIIMYDGMTKKLSDQQAYYELYQNNSITLASKIFNFQKFGLGALRHPLKDPTKIQEYFKLISSDKTLLAEFGNIVLVYEGVVQYYNDLLEECGVHGRNLVTTLKREYELK